MNRSPAQAVRALLEAIERGQAGEALREFFTPDAETTERPNALKPRGDQVPLARMLTASQAGASLLSSQRYEVYELIEIGPRVIVRLTWSGVVARDAGPFRAGQALTAHIAQFIDTHEGRVRRIETFDCFEPFSLPGG